LLDTHIAIYSIVQSSALSGSAKAVVAVGDPRIWWAEALEQLVAAPLPLNPRHIAALHGLPPIRKDPFCRMLIAQASAEGRALVTMDGEIAHCDRPGLQIIIQSGSISAKFPLTPQPR
jgi:PIN domain nuclease of toxin-antitoxin system